MHGSGRDKHASVRLATPPPWGALYLQHVQLAIGLCKLRLHLLKATARLALPAAETTAFGIKTSISIQLQMAPLTGTASAMLFRAKVKGRD